MSLKRLGAGGYNNSMQLYAIIRMAAVHIVNVFTVAKPCQPLPQVPP
jgi:hypothetical protein